MALVVMKSVCTTSRLSENSVSITLPGNGTDWNFLESGKWNVSIQKSSISFQVENDKNKSRPKFAEILQLKDRSSSNIKKCLLVTGLFRQLDECTFYVFDNFFFESVPIKFSLITSFRPKKKKKFTARICNLDVTCSCWGM